MARVAPDSIQEGVVLVDKYGTVLLSPAAALADAAANPTTIQVGADLYVFNGTTWDRVREPTADAMAVTGLLAAALMAYDGTTWNRVQNPPAGGGTNIGRSALLSANPAVQSSSGNFRNASSVAYAGDGDTGFGTPANGVVGFNGTTYDRLRTRGTGILQIEAAFSFLNIAAGIATTTVKSGAGTFHTLVLNNAAVATNTTVIYDNTAASGTVIARPAATTATVPTSLTYDLAFAIGLTIITAVANGSDMTVTYR